MLFNNPASMAFLSWSSNFITKRQWEKRSCWTVATTAEPRHGGLLTTFESEFEQR